MYKPLAVYIHIPFCVRKCSYCDFNSAPPEGNQIEEYIAALKNEIGINAANIMKYRDYIVDTVYIGGGTPSLLEAQMIEDILAVLWQSFEEAGTGSYIPSEITIECNPGTVAINNKDAACVNKFEVYKRAGINRISLGLQSANANELALLGRIHTAGDWADTVKLARRAGFDNINTDLISGIPGQNWEDMKRSLDTVLTTGVEHISVYGLIVEEGTPLYDRFNPHDMTEDDMDRLDENDRLIYENTEELLSHAGYRRYEISNYSKPGFECRHNIKYWTRGDYIGFGLGAASLIDNVRFRNTDSYSEYCRYYRLDSGCDGSKANNFSGNFFEQITAGKNDIEYLKKREQMSEFIFLGLRLIDGISVSEFRCEFGTDIESVYGNVINKYINMGLLIYENGRIKCSKKGLNVSNIIMADFL